VVVSYSYSEFTAIQQGGSAAPGPTHLMWGMLDDTLSCHSNCIGKSDCIRFGTVSHTSFGGVTESAVSIATSSKLVLSLFKERPPVNTTVSVSIPSKVSGEAPAVATYKSDVVQNDDMKWNQAALLKFIDISVQVSLIQSSLWAQYYASKDSSATASAQLTFELAVVVVSAEDPVQVEEGFHATLCDAMKQALAETESQQRDQPSKCFMLSGKPHSVHTVVGGASDAEDVVKSVNHKLRVCFVKQGSYTVFTLIKVKAVGSAAGGEAASVDDVSNWWTLSTPMRIVAL